MSHWTKTQTKLNDREYITKALDRMGVKWQEGGTLKHSYGDARGGKVDIRLDENVGIRKEEDGTYSVVGDHYYSNQFKDARKFQQDLQKNYLVSEAFAKVEEQDFYVYENEEATVGEDGLIRMRARALYVD